MGEGNDLECGVESWMTSAYKQFLGKESEYTTFKVRKGGEQLGKIEKKGHKEAEDYIFASGFAVTSILEIPNYKDVQEQNSSLLPNWRHPSDHFHIQADLEYSTVELLEQPIVVVAEGAAAAVEKVNETGAVPVLASGRKNKTTRPEGEAAPAPRASRNQGS